MGAKMVRVRVKMGHTIGTEQPLTVTACTAVTASRFMGANGLIAWASGPGVGAAVAPVVARG